MEIKDIYIRNFLRVLSAIILVVYTLDIVRNKIVNGKIYIDVNDGYVIFVCIAILVAIEAVRAYVKRKLNNK